AFELSPDFIDPYLESGDLFFELERHKEANQMYKKAASLYEDLLKKSKDNFASRLTFAKVLLNLGRQEEAEKQLNTILKSIDSENTLAAQARSLMESLK
ncbi:MAG: tetratricopeptide repeat protein, partial [Candidatus Omnitrophica bacterium]|nr:tetratricopeptide repeat protein [Candidatus Omnitrophota bacterium]